MVNLDKNMPNSLLEARSFYSADGLDWEVAKELSGECEEYCVFNYRVSFDYSPCLDINIDKFKDMDKYPAELLYFKSKKVQTALSRHIVILVHGYRSKRKDVYIRFAKDFASSGLSSFVYTLPFHFERNPYDINDYSYLERPKMSFIFEMFRCSIIELRKIIGLLSENEAKKTGVMGFSFGGYCASLLGCFEDKVDFIVSMASIGGFGPLLRHIDSNTDRLDKTLIKEHLGLISPIEHKPVIDSSNILFIQGFFDRRTPISDVESFRKRWGKPTVVWYPCDHFSFILFNRVTARKVKRFISGIK